MQPKAVRIAKSSYIIGLFMIPLIINPFGLQMYTQAKLSWFLFFLSLFLASLALVIFCQKKIKIDYHKHLSIFIVLWTTSLVISTALSNNLISIFGAYSNPQGLIFYLLLFTYFFIFLHLFSNKRSISILFNTTKIITALICLHAVGQYFNIDPFIDVDNKKYLFRVYGTIGQPNFLGQFLIFPFSILLFQMKEFWTQKKYQQLALNTPLFLLIISTILLTKNRATWLAIFFGLYILFLFLFKLKKSYKFTFSLAALLAGTALLYLADISVRSIHARMFLWGGVLKILDWKNALFGNGLESFYQTFVKIMPKEVFLYEEFYTFPRSPHNEFLTVLTERGVFGAVLYLTSIAFLIFLLFKGKIKSSIQKITFFTILVYMISVQFSFSTVEHWVFLTAFWAILLRQTLQFKSGTIFFKKVTKKIISIVILSFASIVLLFASFSLLKTDLLLKKGINQYITNPNPRQSYQTLNQAIEMSPFFAYPREIIINLFIPFVSTDIKFAENTEKHIKYFGVITSQDFNYHIISMQFWANMNDLKKSAEHFRQAAEKSPNLPLLYTEAGDLSFSKGDCPTAINNYEKLLFLAPPKYTENQYNCEQVNECRIFLKNASAFFRAMENLQKCKNLIRKR